MENKQKTIEVELLEILSSISSNLSYIEEDLSNIVEKLSGIENNTNNII